MPFTCGLLTRSVCCLCLNRLSLSPQGSQQCRIMCGGMGFARYGGAPCTYPGGAGSLCQFCDNGALSGQMYCNRQLGEQTASPAA
jgi:hypothetical protein